jgi:hypothetical protein
MQMPIAKCDGESGRNGRVARLRGMSWAVRLPGHANVELGALEASLAVRPDLPRYVAATFA